MKEILEEIEWKNNERQKKLTFESTKISENTAISKEVASENKMKQKRKQKTTIVLRDTVYILA